jgi:hypothetical protein
MATDSTKAEAEQNANLKLVDDASESGQRPFATPSTSGTGRSERRSLPVWLFVVVLIAFALLIGWQAQLASELEAEVAGLEQELVRSRALLDAHRTHLGEIRGGVHELSASLEGLRTLVDRDPVESAAAVAEATEPPPDYPAAEPSFP